MKRLLCLFLILGPISICSADLNGNIEIDPWEKWNRKIFVFNQKLDDYFLKPLAKGYKAVLPERAERGVNNFFENLEIPMTIANSLLQAKFSHALEQSGRFALNTVMGFGGIVNVAGYINLGVESTAVEDFAQTLRVWGGPQGPFVMLPLLGPSTFGALPAYYVDYWLNPVNYHQHENSRDAINALDVVNTRVQYLPTDILIRGDAYTFVRDAYLQRIHFLTQDGQVQDTFLEEDF